MWPDQLAEPGFCVEKLHVMRKIFREMRFSDDAVKFWDWVFEGGCSMYKGCGMRWSDDPARSASLSCQNSQNFLNCVNCVNSLNSLTILNSLNSLNCLTMGSSFLQ